MGEHVHQWTLISLADYFGDYWFWRCKICGLEEEQR